MNHKKRLPCLPSLITTQKNNMLCWLVFAFYSSKNYRYMTTLSQRDSRGISIFNNFIGSFLFHRVGRTATWAESTHSTDKHTSCALRTKQLSLELLKIWCRPFWFSTTLYLIKCWHGVTVENISAWNSDFVEILQAMDVSSTKNRHILRQVKWLRFPVAPRISNTLWNKIHRWTVNNN